jgi:hypothetical protein
MKSEFLLGFLVIFFLVAGNRAILEFSNSGRSSADLDLPRLVGL